MARKKTLKQVLIAAVIVFVVGLFVVHFFIMDLDILWARFSRKFL
jgi:hypothetical protein